MRDLDKGQKNFGIFQEIARKNTMRNNWILLCLAALYFTCVDATKIMLGSCDFEVTDSESGDNLCGYTHGSLENDDHFNWKLETNGEGHYMAVKTEDHTPGQVARLQSMKIHQQDTHCFTFQYHLEGGINGNNDTSSMNTLNVYVLNQDVSELLLPVWKSGPEGLGGGWTTVQLALSPRAYEIVFEAQIHETTTGIIALDNIVLNNEACVGTPHFLRVSNKEVNENEDVELTCLLWGHDLDSLERDVGSPIVLQKSTGEEFEPNSQTEIDDTHLSVKFLFPISNRETEGRYRCVSHNSTSVGVSNFARISVKVPPVPQSPPEMRTQGSTHLKLNLNSETFIGDGPIVQTMLKYRPVNGSWSDVHEISKQDYHLWHLQPDTTYEIKVILSRPGRGGTGDPGPKLLTRTDCGVPLRPVQKIQLQPIASSEIKVSWQKPDFSVTQCHYHACTIKYRLYMSRNKTTPVEVPYELADTVENNNFGIITGLEPYTRYEVKVELVNSVGSIESGLYRTRTGQDVPGAVPSSSFVVTANNETSISVKWDEPEVINGVLEIYEVAYRGMSSYQPDFTPQQDTGLLQIRANERTLTLSRLHPGTNYTLMIRAQTGAGFGPSIETPASTKIAAPKMRVYPSPTPDDGSSGTTIEIDILPAEPNGAPVSHYYIVIEEVPDDDATEKTSRSRNPPKSNKRGKKKNRKPRQKRSSDVFMRVRRQTVVDTGETDNPCHAEPITYDEAMKQNKTYYFGGKLSPDSVTEGTKFVVGEGDGSGGFTNPPLNPNKKYNIYVRVDSNVGDDTKVNCALVAIKSSVPVTTTILPTAPSTTPPIIAEKTERPDPDAPTTTPSSSDGRDVDSGQVEDNDKKLMYASIGGGIFIILIVAIIIIIVVKMRRRGKMKQKDEVVNPFEVRMMMSDMQSGTTHSMVRTFGSPDRQALMMPDVVDFENHDFLEKTLDASGTRVSGTYRSGSTAMVEDRPALRVDDFHIHVNDMKRQNNFGFHEEFSSFREGQTSPWEVGRRDENKPKNRYGNIMAYDHSRVLLQPTKGPEGEVESDYINANYVLGYKNPQMYIAAQAPSADTVDDFWQMIWQEKTAVIVMVTNLVELGKRKCHKYWPEETAQYGSIQVSMTDTESLSDYSIRTFSIQQNGDYDVREVKQFHFTSWPDHGVPNQPTNILSFVRRIKNYEPPGLGPTIVHCSAGCGRTGCLIVIDMMLDMAREEGVIDIYNTVTDLRSRRINMVQTEEQYIFIHDSVLEALLCGDTLVMAQDLRQHYDDLITVDQNTQIAPVQEEFETLNVMTPKLSDEECSVARLPRNRQCNRFMDVLPSDRKMPYLVTQHPSDPESNYINAVFTDSYSKRDAFIVTQMPLPNTVIDFWRLVYDYSCSSVVMMNDASEHDQTCCQYWPDSGSAVFGPFTVEIIQKEDEVDVVTRVFKLQNVNRPNEGVRLVQQFQLTNWPATQPVPYTRNAVLRVIQLSTKWQAECSNPKDGRTLVHCVAGAGRSGTFIACHNLCMQLRCQGAVDVFNVVQRQRNVRPQLVETLEQYRFCYEVGWDFADQ